MNFLEYLTATAIGFAPGTTAYVYTGMVGKDLSSGSPTMPWYSYLVGFGLLFLLIKVISDAATKAFEDIEAEEETKTQLLKEDQARRKY